MKPSETVKLGQIWQDWDIRRRVGRWRRFVEIVDIDINMRKGKCVAICKNTLTNRLTEIRLDRFKPNSTGYKLCQNKEWENL